MFLGVATPQGQVSLHAKDRIDNRTLRAPAHRDDRDRLVVPTELGHDLRFYVFATGRADGRLPLAGYSRSRTDNGGHLRARRTPSEPVGGATKRRSPCCFCALSLALVLHLRNIVR